VATRRIKNFDKFSRFDTIPERDEQTDRQRDRHLSTAKYRAYTWNRTDKNQYACTQLTSKEQQRNIHADTEKP